MPIEKTISRIQAIDGFRAFSVTIVVLYHIHFHTWAQTKGYLGVDLFFLISGYVITRKIKEDIEQEFFSFVDFYASRIVRLFPTLILTLVLTLGFASFLFYPDSLKNLNLSILSIFGLVSNIYFWQHTSYFDSTTASLPTIHTWSLSVEEQFYLFFPGIFFYFYKYKHRAVTLIGGVAITSFVITALFHEKAPNAVFYLLPFRVWEFGLGAFIAVKPARHHAFCRSPQFKRVISTINIIVLVLAVSGFLDSHLSAFAIQFLVVASGAVIIILSREKILINSLLSKGLVLLVGRMSYVIYLIHQPILAIQAYCSSGPISDRTKIYDLIVIFIVSFVIYQYFERPIQFYWKEKRNRKNSFIVLRYALVSVLLVSSIAALQISQHALLKKYSSSEIKIINYVNSDNSARLEWGKCFYENAPTFKHLNQKCLNTGRGRNIFLFGDSHAAMISSGFESTHVNLSRFSMSGCSPLLNSSQISQNCLAFNKQVLKQIEINRPDSVLIKANWFGYSNGGNLDSNYLKGLGDMITAIKKDSPSSRIYLLGNTPQWKPNLPLQLIIDHKLLIGNQFLKTPLLSSLKLTDSQLVTFASNENIHFVSFLNNLCRQEQCVATIEEGGITEPFAFDYGHTTEFGSTRLAKLTVQAIL